MDKTNVEQKVIINQQERPNAKKYIELLFSDFIELSGDRLYGEDPAIIGGIAYLDKIPITVVAQLRGSDLEEQIKYNFSMMHPEGYRKSIRLMKQAEKFNRPIVCFVDTIGAYPGISAEERGQASAIANHLNRMMCLKVPVITILIGNGFSGGALAFCPADRIVALENATLSVISPKACADILWKDPSRGKDAEQLLKMSARDLLKQGIVDNIILEPKCGVYKNIQWIADELKGYLLQEISILKKKSVGKLLRQRRKKIGLFNTEEFSGAR